MRLYTYLGLWVPSWVAFDIFVCIDSKSMMVSRNKSCNSLHFVFCIFIMHIVHTRQNRPTILFEKVDGVFPHKYIINIRKVAWIQFWIVPFVYLFFGKYATLLLQRRESSSLHSATSNQDISLKIRSNLKAIMLKNPFQWFCN